jgi:predicted nucleotidyltransferase
MSPVDVGACTIFLTLAGSQAQGTARADSDVDLRGVCIAPLGARLSLQRKFEQEERVLDDAAWCEPFWRLARARVEAHPTAASALAVKAESVVYDIAKFLAMCAEGNPNALEILFADERDWIHVTPAWQRLHERRQLFLTRKVQQTYLGYGLSQLKRIRTHRSWLLEPPQHQPTRTEFGLPEQGTFNADDRRRLEQSLSEGLELPPEVSILLEAERRYRAAMKHWESYERWKAERNPARAELERRYGYDTKHAMHLIRLMRMGLEVLERGQLIVRRPDAAELVAVREGALGYEQLVARAEELERSMRDAVAASSLPPQVDYEAVDRLLLELVAQPLPSRVS